MILIKFLSAFQSSQGHYKSKEGERNLPIIQLFYSFGEVADDRLPANWKLDKLSGFLVVFFCF